MNTKKKPTQKLEMMNNHLSTKKEDGKGYLIFQFVLIYIIYDQVMNTQKHTPTPTLIHTHTREKKRTKMNTVF